MAQRSGMIKARHQWWAERLFHVYIMQLLRRHFEAFHLTGALPETDRQRPTILVPNHNSWWDGFWIYLFTHKMFRQRIYMMMLNHQLQHYSFFSRVGAYGIDPQNAKSSLQALRYTLQLLDKDTQPKSLICLFPQGELQPWNASSLQAKPGLEWLIKKYSRPLNLILLSMRAEFLDHQRPEVYFRCQSVQIEQADDFEGMEWLQESLIRLMQQVEADILNKTTGRILMNRSTHIQPFLQSIMGR